LRCSSCPTTESRSAKTCEPLTSQTRPRLFRHTYRTPMSAVGASPRIPRADLGRQQRDASPVRHVVWVCPLFAHCRLLLAWHRTTAIRQEAHRCPSVVRPLWRSRATLSTGHHGRSLADRSWQRAPRRRGRGALRMLHLGALSQRESVLDIDAEVANRALDLRMAEQDLHGTQVSSLLVDDGRLGFGGANGFRSLPGAVRSQSPIRQRAVHTASC
jgi:hypothetical protein